jgi:hypothetical protein
MQSLATVRIDSATLAKYPRAGSVAIVALILGVDPITSARAEYN